MMRELLERLIKAELQPVLDKLSSQSSEIEELRRRLNNMIRIGVVTEVDDPPVKIKVQHGQLKTPFIRWLTMAGETAEYRCPTIGEQCLILNFAAGDNSSQTVALMGLFSDSFPLPFEAQSIHTTKYKDGTTISYDHEAHTLNVTMSAGSATFVVPDSVTFDTPLLACTGEITAEQNITSQAEVIDHTSSMQDMRDKYNAHNHGKSVSPPGPNKME